MQWGDTEGMCFAVTLLPVHAEASTTTYLTSCGGETVDTLIHIMCASYLQCWCAWYSRPPQPEFPAVVCGSPGYQPPYGAAAGCGG